MIRVLAVLGTVLWAGSAGGAVIFVKAVLTSGGQDGTSWADAFRGRSGLQAALAAAHAGDDIWVAQGVYVAAGPGGDQSVSFNLKTGVRVLGGFSGVETHPDARAPSVFPTFLSGDLNGNDGSGNFDAFWDNTYHVVRAVGPGASGTLDGFVIEAGRQDGVQFPAVPGGTGVLIEGASPHILACVVRRNMCFEGAGALVLGGSPVFENCVFTGNIADTGGGISVRGAGLLTVRRCEFTDPDYSFGTTTGIGIYAGSDGSQSGAAAVLIEDCEFSIQTNNVAANGTGLTVADGAVAVVRGSRFDRCRSSGGGGGIASYDAGGVFIDRCRFSGCEGVADGGSAIVATAFPQTANGPERLLITNSVFTGNGRLGGGATVLVGGVSSRYVNCTFYDNGSTGKVHKQVDTNAALLVDNCVLWGNTSFDGAPGLAVAPGVAAMVRSSCVQGWAGEVPSSGTFAADPLFVDSDGVDGVSGTIDDDLRLSSASLCIDRGVNGLIPAGLVLDVAGLPRFRDQPGVSDLGSGGPPVADIGANEFVPPCPADFNADGVINTADLTALLSTFGQSVNAFAGADLDGDGLVSTQDLTAVLASFGDICPE